MGICMLVHLNTFEVATEIAVELPEVPSHAAVESTVIQASTELEIPGEAMVSHSEIDIFGFRISFFLFSPDLFLIFLWFGVEEQQGNHYLELPCLSRCPFSRSTGLGMAFGTGTLHHASQCLWKGQQLGAQHLPQRSPHGHRWSRRKLRSLRP